MLVFELDETLVETEELKALSCTRAAAKLRPDPSDGEVVDAFGDFIGVGDTGFQPATSAARKQYDNLLEVYGVCKTPANGRVPALALFPIFQEIYPGCCTVAAPNEVVLNFR